MYRAYVASMRRWVGGRVRELPGLLPGFLASFTAGLSIPITAFSLLGFPAEVEGR